MKQPMRKKQEFTRRMSFKGPNLILYSVAKRFNQLVPVKSHLNHLLKNLFINLYNEWQQLNILSLIKLPQRKQNLELLSLECSKQKIYIYSKKPFLPVALYQVVAQLSNEEGEPGTIGAGEFPEWSFASLDQQQASLGLSLLHHVTNDQEECISHPEDRIKLGQCLKL